MGVFQNYRRVMKKRGAALAAAMTAGKQLVEVDVRGAKGTYRAHRWKKGEGAAGKLARQSKVDKEKAAGKSTVSDKSSAEARAKLHAENPRAAEDIRIAKRMEEVAKLAAAKIEPPKAPAFKTDPYKEDWSGIYYDAIWRNEAVLAKSASEFVQHLNPIPKSGPGVSSASDLRPQK